MGNFRIIIDGIGNHGCQRASDGIDQTKSIYWCKQQDCPDCIAKEFAEKINKCCSSVKAKILHWPDADGNIVDGTVVDDIVIENHNVGLFTDSELDKHAYLTYHPTSRNRSKPM